MTDTTADPVRRGAWSLIASPVLAQRLAAVGFDWICLDAQHGGWDRGSMLHAFRGIAGTGTVMVRVAELDAAQIGAALDLGAAGVIVPMVEDAAAAALAARAGRYPPRGARSWGPIAPSWGAAAPSAAEADTRTRIWPMIETSGALDGVEEIAAVDGIDGLFVGPFDLALALGIDLDTLIADRADDAPLPRIVAAARRAGIDAGAFAGSAERAAALAAIGFDWLAVATDTGIIDDGAARALAPNRADGPGSAASGY